MQKTFHMSSYWKIKKRVSIKNKHIFFWLMLIFCLKRCVFIFILYFLISSGLKVFNKSSFCLPICYFDDLNRNPGTLLSGANMSQCKLTKSPLIVHKTLVVFYISVKYVTPKQFYKIGPEETCLVSRSPFYRKNRKSRSYNLEVPSNRKKHCI